MTESDVKPSPINQPTKQQQKPLDNFHSDLLPDHPHYDTPLLSGTRGKGKVRNDFQSCYWKPPPQTLAKGNLLEIGLCGIKSQQASNKQFPSTTQVLPTSSSACEACQFHVVDALPGVSEF